MSGLAERSVRSSSDSRRSSLATWLVRAVEGESPRPAFQPGPLFRVAVARAELFVRFASRRVSSRLNCGDRAAAGIARRCVACSRHWSSSERKSHPFMLPSLSRLVARRVTDNLLFLCWNFPRRVARRYFGERYAAGAEHLNGGPAQRGPRPKPFRRSRTLRTNVPNHCTRRHEPKNAGFPVRSHGTTPDPGLSHRAA